MKTSHQVRKSAKSGQTIPHNYQKKKKKPCIDKVKQGFVLYKYL